jgi:hypothetical protein
MIVVNPSARCSSISLSPRLARVSGSSAPKGSSSSSSFGSAASARARAFYGLRDSVMLVEDGAMTSRKALVLLTLEEA